MGHNQSRLPACPPIVQSPTREETMEAIKQLRVDVGEEGTQAPVQAEHLQRIQHPYDTEQVPATLSDDQSMVHQLYLSLTHPTLATLSTILFELLPILDDLHVTDPDHVEEVWPDLVQLVSEGVSCGIMRLDIRLASTFVQIDERYKLGQEARKRILDLHADFRAFDIYTKSIAFDKWGDMDAWDCPEKRAQLVKARQDKFVTGWSAFYTTFLDASFSLT